MITDQDCARLNVGIYEYAGQPPIAWDAFDRGETSDGICWGLKRFGDIDAIVLRGSSTFQDWMRDLGHFAIADDVPGLGLVHPGFVEGMAAAYARIKPLLREQVVITGHSLGAGRAAILCGIMCDDGRSPQRRVVFGEPKSGFQQLADLIGAVPSMSYRNGNGKHHDLVTDVPFSFPPENYVRSGHTTEVRADPPPNDSWGIFCWHHMMLYAKAINA